MSIRGIEEVFAMYDISANPANCMRRPAFVPSSGKLMHMLGMVMLSLFCLASICTTSVANEYYAGLQYDFSTPESGETPDIWTYSWEAVPPLDSLFTPADAANVAWTALMLIFQQM